MIKLQQLKEIKLFDTKVFKQRTPVKTCDNANFNDLEKTHLNLKNFFNTKSFFLSTQIKKSQFKRSSFPRIQQTQKNITQFFSQKQSRNKFSRWTRIKTIDYNRQINQQLSIQKIKSQSSSLSPSPKKAIVKIQVPSTDRKSQKSKEKYSIIESPKRMQKKLQIAFQNSLILNRQKQSSIVDKFPNCIKFKRKKFPQLKKSIFQADSNRYYSPWDVKAQEEQF